MPGKELLQVMEKSHSHMFFRSAKCGSAGEKRTRLCLHTGVSGAEDGNSSLLPLRARNLQPSAPSFSPDKKYQMRCKMGLVQDVDTYITNCSPQDSQLCFRSQSADSPSWVTTATQVTLFCIPFSTSFS